MTAAAVYLLCMITALVCAYLLLRSFGAGRYKLLLWSGLCFSGLALENVILLVDKVFLPDTDLAMLRLSVALIAMSVLVWGLVWNAE